MNSQRHYNQNNFKTNFQERKSHKILFIGQQIKNKKITVFCLNAQLQIDAQTQMQYNFPCQDNKVIR